MSTYCGNFYNGKPHGGGAFYMAFTRTLYNGNWAHGKKQGQGWLFYSKNNWYDGEWFDDSKSGFGTRLYTDGTKYTGMWEKGVRHGQGACAFSNGDFYQGEWYQGELNGYGEYTWKAFFNKSLTFPIENIYQGGWVNGMRNGFGHMYFGLQHGARLIGFWSMNYKHGPGIVINCNGDVTEHSPLFNNDKPVHMGPVGTDSVYMEAKGQQNENEKTIVFCLHSMIHRPVSYQEWLLRSSTRNSADRTLSSTSGISDMERLSGVVESNNSGLRPALFSRNIQTSGIEQVANIQRIDRLQDFPEERLICNPLILHIHAAPETLDLRFFVKKYITEAQENLSESILSSVGDIRIQDEVGSDTSTWKGTSQLETIHLRNVIWHNTKNLQSIYRIYANISNHPKAPNRKCTLIRLYLWQFYRNIKIYEFGLSLFDTDLILLENPNHCLETQHDPFERIYYWQFLWSLIGVTWQIHINKKCKIEIFNLQSIYILFEKFLKEIVYPRSGQHIGPCLFEFKDLLPMKSVIDLFEMVGPELTARQFLNKCCCKIHTEPACHLQHFGDNNVVQPEYGCNIIAVGRNFVYLPDKKDDVLTKTAPDLYPLKIDKFFKSLKVFRHLGPQRVLNCLTLVCPIIKKDGLIVNIDVQLTFLEFYETLIYCAYKSVLLENLKQRIANYVFDESKGRSEKFDKRKRSQGKKDLRKRRK